MKKLFSYIKYQCNLSALSSRRLLFIAIFSMLFSASSTLLAQSSTDMAQNALRGQLVDLASTGAGLAMGATEANPLGILAIFAKVVAHQKIKEAPYGDRPRLYNAYGAFGWGAAANNLCVIASIATGVPSIACPVVGVVGGVFSFLEDEELQKEAVASASHCEETRRARPDFSCPKQIEVAAISPLNFMSRRDEDHCHFIRRIRLGTLCDVNSMQM